MSLKATHAFNSSFYSPPISLLFIHKILRIISIKNYKRCVSKRRLRIKHILILQKTLLYNIIRRYLINCKLTKLKCGKKTPKKTNNKKHKQKTKNKTFIIHNVSKMFHNIIIHNVSKTFASKSIYIYSDKIMIFRVDWISQTESPQRRNASSAWSRRDLVCEKVNLVYLILQKSHIIAYLFL